MEEIIKSTLLEFDKSSFLIELVKHRSGKLYIKINQTIPADEERFHSHIVKINPSILDDILFVLNDYKKDFQNTYKNSRGYFSPDKKKEIVHRYLKGCINIPDLALQFRCSEEIITQILRNAEIEIVNNNMSKVYKGRRKRRQTKY